MPPALRFSPHSAAQNHLLFLELGLNMMGRTPTNHDANCKRMVEFFGTDQYHIADIWFMVNDTASTIMPRGARPVHLLWALLFLKNYCSEAVLCALVGGVDKKTFMKWTWLFVNSIAGLSEDFVSHFAL